MVLVGVLVGVIVCGVPLAVMTTLYVQESISFIVETTCDLGFITIFIVESQSSSANGTNSNSGSMFLSLS